MKINLRFFKCLCLVIPLGLGSMHGFSKEIEDRETIDLIGSRSYTYSIEQLIKQFAQDLPGLVRQTNKTVIVGYTQSPNLSGEFENFTLKKLQEVSLAVEPGFQVTKCIECLNIRIDVEGEETFVKKGVTDLEDLKKAMVDYKANSYMTVNISYIGTNLVLQVSVYNGADRNLLLSKEYRSKVYSVREEGLIFGVAGNVGLISGANRKNIIGGRFYMGERLASVGETGLFGKVYSVPDQGSMFNLGLFVDLDINDIAKTHWKAGSLLLGNDIGFMFFDEKVHLTYAIGPKFSFAGIFNLSLAYQLDFYFRTSADETDESKEILKLDTEDKKASYNKRLNQRKSLPGMIVMGIGVDFG